MLPALRNSACSASHRFLTCRLNCLRPTFAALQKAAAIDPHNVAAQPGPEGEAAAQVRKHRCLLSPVAGRMPRLRSGV